MCRVSLLFGGGVGGGVDAAGLCTLQANIPYKIRRRRVGQFQIPSNGDDLAAMVGAVVHAVMNHKVARAAVLSAVEESEMADFGESRVGKCLHIIFELLRHYQNALENVLRRACESLEQKRFGRYLAQPFEPDFLGTPDVEQRLVKAGKTGRHFAGHQFHRFGFQPVDDLGVSPKVEGNVVFKQ